MAKQTLPPLSPQAKNDWNNFVDFMDKQGMRGNSALDDRDKNLGQFYFQKFKTMYPHTTLAYQDVPRVQQALQDYRTQSLADIKAGKIQLPGVKDPDKEYMSDLSPVDGWLGSKTSVHKFPVAVAQTIPQAGNKQVQNYGTDVDKFRAENPLP